jgi:hypothetical protein
MVIIDTAPLVGRSAATEHLAGVVAQVAQRNLGHITGVADLLQRPPADRL